MPRVQTPAHSEGRITQSQHKVLVNNAIFTCAVHTVIIKKCSIRGSIMMQESLQKIIFCVFVDIKDKHIQEWVSSWDIL